LEKFKEVATDIIVTRLLSSSGNPLGARWLVHPHGVEA